MAHGNKLRRVAKGSSLDTEPFAKMLARTRQAARVALERYGEPQMSVAELRSAMAKALPDTSFAQVLLREREAEW